MKKNIIETKSDYWALINSLNYNIVNKNRIEEDYKKLLFLATNGNIEAIKQLGIMYSDGKGVEKDAVVAKEWFEKGALLGDLWCKDKMMAYEQ